MQFQKHDGSCRLKRPHDFQELHEKQIQKKFDMELNDSSSNDEFEELSRVFLKKTRISTTRKVHDNYKEGSQSFDDNDDDDDSHYDDEDDNDEYYDDDKNMIKYGYTEFINEVLPFLKELQKRISFNEVDFNNEEEVKNMLKKARDVFPFSSKVWIASSRLEESRGDMEMATTLIMDAVHNNMNSEYLWIEAIRLQPSDIALNLIRPAILHMPTSPFLWIIAADNAETEESKREILLEALQLIPDSADLWIEAAKIEKQIEKGRKLLYEAVKCCDDSVELWLMLANLETHEKALNVLKQAGEIYPVDSRIPLEIAKLEEANKNLDAIKGIIENMFISLADYGLDISRMDWIEKAITLEKCGAVVCALEVIESIFRVHEDTEDGSKMWMEIVDHCINAKAHESARKIYECMFEAFPKKKKIWMRALFFDEWVYESNESLEKLMKIAMIHFPRDMALYHMIRAKINRSSGNLEIAHDYLIKAFRENPKYADILTSEISKNKDSNL